MATPAVSGTAGLLLELWRNTKGWDQPDPLSSTYKALFIHTAREAGPADGPDYRFGWGLVDATQAARTLQFADQEGYFHVSEETLARARDARYEYTLYTDAYDDEFKVTIAWVDPAGTPVDPPALNNRTPMLVNDLDLRVTDVVTGREYRPWTLNPARPGDAATPGDNTRDNVEQVVVKDYDPHNHRAWRISVTHKGVLAADQKFSLIATGAYQRVGCEADYNGDGFVDFFDYDAFVADFESGSSLADINGDFMIDQFDYMQYVEAFERGC
jgi:hypothetical protein